MPPSQLTLYPADAQPSSGLNTKTTGQLTPKYKQNQKLDVLLDKRHCNLRQNLDRHLAAQLRIAGAIDFAHAAGTD